MTDEQFNILKNLIILVIRGIGYILASIDNGIANKLHKEFLKDIEKAV